MTDWINASNGMSEIDNKEMSMRNIMKLSFFAANVNNVTIKALLFFLFLIWCCFKKFRQIVSITSFSLDALSCCQVIGLFVICINKQNGEQVCLMKWPPSERANVNDDLSHGHQLLLLLLHSNCIIINKDNQRLRSFHNLYRFSSLGALDINK